MLDKGYILGEKYVVIKALREVDIGQVYLCKDIKFKGLWIIREIKNGLKKDFNILSQPNILKKLSHPCVARIIEAFYEKNNFYIVQQYIQGQTLENYVKKNKLQAEVIFNITSSICNAVIYFNHINLPIKYRYHNPSDIIITKNRKVILINFGISGKDEITKYYNSLHMDFDKSVILAHDNLEKFTHNEEIFNIGRIMYFITNGSFPAITLQPILDENYDINVDSGLKRIIQKCFEIDAKDRYVSIEELNNEIIIEKLKRSKCRNISVLNDCNIDLDKSIKSNNVEEQRRFNLRKSTLMLVIVISIIFLFVCGMRLY